MEDKPIESEQYERAKERAKGADIGREEAQRIASKLELLSEKTLEKYRPGFKAKFDELRDEKAMGGSEEQFLDRLSVECSMWLVDEEELDRLIQER